jgi:hypothetical protein
MPFMKLLIKCTISTEIERKCKVSNFNRQSKCLCVNLSTIKAAQNPEIIGAHTVQEIRY